jgi:hypothetical protein
MARLLIEQPKRGPGRGVPRRYPLLRGSFLPLRGCETLLWAQGDVPGAVGGAHYHKEGLAFLSPAPPAFRSPWQLETDPQGGAGVEQNELEYG